MDLFKRKSYQEKKDEIAIKRLEFESWARKELNKSLDYHATKEADFEIGDFVYNVTGIIKVRRITCEEFRGDLMIHYHGLRYKKVKGVLSRTRDKRESTLTHKLKKINI